MVSKVCALALTALFAFASAAPPGPDASESGYIKVNGTHDANLFYWFFNSRSDSAATDPVVLWLTGGPGCSSEVALFEENGPYKVNNTDLKLSSNPYSWSTRANLLYVDQPVGTGFSYTDSDLHDWVKSEKEVAQDMFEFLQGWLLKHPQYQKNEFFITGESYAGHYIPAIGYRLVQGNQNKEGLHINLQGLAIGNGLVNPEIQYGAYADFAFENKLINKTLHAAINDAYPVCRELIKGCAKLSVSCIAAFEECNLAVVEPITIAAGLRFHGEMNPYDIREKCEYPPLCYDFSGVDKFLKEPSVLSALGVSPKAKWTECEMGVHFFLLADWMANLEVNIPATLAAGVRVLVYAGEEDFICNWLGNSRWTDAMVWPGQYEFGNFTSVPWTPEGASAPAGEAKHAKGLTFLKVYKAGHMVPLNQPEAALAMLDTFTSGKSFVGGKDDKIKMPRKAGPAKITVV
mmetsp:Transcript_23819/g.28753  ORF Transcript_23819/g.28753 Transcript_23819/m.28753 type:complete len:461 (-) Transcript_23819:114-1496(-)|eukprot:CAMPEP_0197857360 /NCGR_PEP_ID=MMETSP1438-20131217/30330_1 /TAXON_ID=1461541 /ORGANISM="Pterosperma sp., Strain CCMP1384" /LENGTH=460 /DNA_ID=CAMNT_0043473169 /DNA_START=68 /DNA_END=1450 /DNA_ORIENTATION=+